MIPTVAKTLLILTPGFPKDEADTTCLPSQQLFVQAMNRVYPQVRIIILSLDYPFSNQPYFWNGNQVIPFHAWKKSRLKKLGIYFSVWRTLHRLKKENQILGLLGFWCTAGSLLSTYFGRRYGLPHYAWILGQDAKKENGYVRLMRPRSGELIAMSDFLADEFQRNHGVSPAHMIPNAIDPDSYPAFAGERDIDILGVGSLIPLKQYDIFISVVRQLVPKMPSLRAVICGKGPEWEALAARIKAFHLQDHIQMIGEKSHAETLALMQRSRLLIHPSAYEGFSTVCLEALYAGAGVISFCNPKNSWIRNWHIVKTEEEMSKLALELLTEKDSDEERVLVFSMEDQARAMMALFSQDD